MFKQAPRLLARASAAAMKSRRPFSSDLQAGAPVDTKFVDAWRSAVPNIDPPKTLSAYMAPRPPTPSTIPSKLTINVVLPYSSVFAGEEVDMVIIPASTGQMGVLPGHVATIAELKPGLMSVHSGTDVKKYFVSGGFAFIHANSVAEVIAVEAVPIEHFDQALVQKNLADFTQKVNTATNDLEKAEAQIGVDVHSALFFFLFKNSSSMSGVCLLWDPIPLNHTFTVLLMLLLQDKALPRCLDFT